MSVLSRFLQCRHTVIALRRDISTEFEQQAHTLQHPMERGDMQRGPAEPALHIYIRAMF